MNRKLVRPKISELKKKEELEHEDGPPGSQELAGTSNPGSPRRPRHPQASHSGPPRPNPRYRSQSGPPRSNPGAYRRRPTPPDQTAAEAFYYLKQMNTQTPMVVVLNDGEQLRGHIEWYDRNCLKVHREDGPNLLVYKHSIRYLYKMEDE